MSRLSWSALLRMADPIIFERGEDYVDQVEELRVNGNHATALVYGTRPYAVTLDFSGELTGTCACPYFQGGDVCKHLVACGLAVMRAEASPQEAEESAAAWQLPSSGGPADLVQDMGLEELVHQLPHELVAELLIAAAHRDPLLEDQIRVQAAPQDGRHKALTDLVAKQLRVYEFADYREAFALAADAAAVLDELEQQMTQGHAAATLGGLLYAVEKLRRMMETTDDSSGVLGEQCQRAADLYASACRTAQPDPVALGHWLAEFRDESPGWPEVRLQDFSPALGTVGVEAYRQAVAACELKYRHASQWERFEIDRMRLELADHDGDLDAAVSILASGESPQYGDIIGRLREAGREDDAVLWTDRAVAAGRVSGQNNSFWLNIADVAQLYLDLGRADDAVDLAQNYFTKNPGWSSYQVIAKVAQEVSRTDELHHWALDTARALTAQRPRGEAALVEIALRLGEVELAWEVAEESGAGRWWKELARASADSYPHKAAAVYTAEVERLLPQTNTAIYPTVAEHLVDLKDLYSRMGRQEEFAGWLDTIRHTYRRRTRMLKDLDSRGLS